MHIYDTLSFFVLTVTLLQSAWVNLLCLLERLFKKFLELLDFALPLLCACAHVIWSYSDSHLLFREFTWLLTQPSGQLLSRLKDSINGLSACSLRWLNVFILWQQSPSEQISLNTHMPCRVYKSFCSHATQLYEISVLWAFGVLQTIMFNVLERFRTGLPVLLFDEDCDLFSSLLL